MTDLEEYKNSRDFYYPLEKYTYGEVAKNFDDLIKKVKQNKINKKKLDKFYEFFCSSCDGHSTKRVVDFFLGK